MIDQQHLRATEAVDALDDIAQSFALVLGEAGAGLVHHDQPRRADGRARDLAHATLVGVEVAPQHPGFRGKADEIERLGDSGGARNFAVRDIVEHGGDIVGGAEVFDHLLVLERAADAERGAFVRGDAGEILAVDPHRTGERDDEAREHVDQRRFAGAIGPHQTGDGFGQARRQRV